MMIIQQFYVCFKGNMCGMDPVIHVLTLGHCCCSCKEEALEPCNWTSLPFTTTENQLSIILQSPWRFKVKGHLLFSVFTENSLTKELVSSKAHYTVWWCNINGTSCSPLSISLPRLTGNPWGLSISPAVAGLALASALSPNGGKYPIGCSCMSLANA